MNQSSDHDDAQMGHPDLDEAERVDDHGPVFDAAYEGLEDEPEVSFGG